jgi:hypothetical protein
MKPLNILIGMPSVRGIISNFTVVTLVTLIDLLQKSDIKYRFVNIDSADIVLARNMMASFAYRLEDITHLFFIDDDMTFSPDVIMTLLRADKGVIGCVCPKRTFDHKAFYEQVKSGATYEQAMSLSHEFVTNHLPTEDLKIENGMCRLRGIGMAVTLIKRQVLVEMVEKNIVKGRTIAGNKDVLGNEKLYGFFEQIYSEETDSLFSEDLSFCDRYTYECGGQVWGVVTHEIGHVGLMNYKGTYLERLRAGKP